jgi:hypothetical protein
MFFFSDEGGTRAKVSFELCVGVSFFTSATGCCKTGSASLIVGVMGAESFSAAAE